MLTHLYHANEYSLLQVYQTDLYFLWNGIVVNTGLRAQAMYEVNRQTLGSFVRSVCEIPDSPGIGFDNNTVIKICQIVKYVERFVNFKLLF